MKKTAKKEANVKETKKTAKKEASSTKKEPEKKVAAPKEDTAFVPHNQKHPYHEMMITAEKIKMEKKVETKNVKTAFSFNPKNRIRS